MIFAMLITSRVFSQAGAFLACAANVAALINERAFASTCVVTKDVVILGGGASGAHAAVRLREDLGKSVLVVEKQGHLVRFRITFRPNVTRQEELGEGETLNLTTLLGWPCCDLHFFRNRGSVRLRRPVLHRLCRV
jgi:hypothetical protein